MNFDTKHHSFQSVGLSIEKLSQSLLEFWTEYSKKTGASPSYAKDCLENGSVTFTPICFHQIVMDGHSNADGISRIPLQLTGFTQDPPQIQTTEHWLSISEINHVVSLAQKVALTEMAYSSQRLPQEALINVCSELSDAVNALR